MHQFDRLAEVGHVGDAGVVFTIFTASIRAAFSQAANDRRAERFSQQVNAVGAGGDDQGLHANIQHLFEQCQPRSLPKRQPCVECSLGAHVFFPFAVRFEVNVTKNDMRGAGAGSDALGLSHPHLFIIAPTRLPKSNG